MKFHEILEKKHMITFWGNMNARNHTVTC